MQGQSGRCLLTLLPTHPQPCNISRMAQCSVAGNGVLLSKEAPVISLHANAGWDVPADIAANMSLASILTRQSHRWDQPVEGLYKMYGLQKKLQHVETQQATCVPTG